jgi:hypothetical protein
MFFYKTKLWCKWLDRQEFDSFPTLDNSLHSNTWSFSSLVGKKFMIYWCIKNTSKYCSRTWRNFSRAVCNRCGYKSVLHCLPNLNTQPSISWEWYARWLTSDGAVKIVFSEKFLLNFRIHVWSKYLQPSNTFCHSQLPTIASLDFQI